MVKYIKCPKCDLNYIDSEKQEYCDICIAKLKGKKLQFADLDEEEYSDIDNELEAEELCPVCGTNYIRAGEKMCEQCRALQEFDEEEEVDIDKDDEWKNYLEDDEDDDLIVDTEIAVELDDEFDDEEEDDEFYHGEDDDPLDDLDDFDSYDDDEDDEDDEDEDEDDEDDDF